MGFGRSGTVMLAQATAEGGFNTEVLLFGLFWIDPHLVRFG